MQIMADTKSGYMTTNTVLWKVKMAPMPLLSAQPRACIRPHWAVGINTQTRRQVSPLRGRDLPLKISREPKHG